MNIKNDRIWWNELTWNEINRNEGHEMKQVAIGFNSTGLALVRLGEDEREEDFAFHQPGHEVDVDLLGFVAWVDEDEHVGKPFAILKVIGHEVVEPVPLSLGCLGVAVARKVNEAPVFVYDEKVDQPGVARFLGNASERLLIAEHV